MTTSPLSPQAAAAELLRRRRGRASLVGYANAVEIPGKPIDDDPEGWLFNPVETGVASHHRLFLEAMERTAARRHGRCMIFAPPGSAKSSYASVVAPTYFMGRQPDQRIILASYGTDLARRHGRRARQIANSPGFRALWSGQGFNPARVELSASTSAADEWAITNGSEYLARGLLAGITGARAHGIVIDDPVKGREQADSPTIRQKTWEAYTDDLLTRLIPGGWVFLIQCLTGDTPVLMADGTEKPLCDVRPGDLIATYEDGRIGVSSIANWKSNGHDSVFRIKTISGAIVKANGRHPFLVQKGSKQQWVRLKDLAPGDLLLRAIGANGEASNAQPLSAKRAPKRAASAFLTTTNFAGLKGFARRLLERILRLASAPSSSTDTASPSTTTSESSLSKAASARSAGGRQGKPATRSTGTTFFASTIATIRARFGACSVTTAILPSAEERRPKCSKRPLATFDVIPDQILSIEALGVEEVFDVQVDRTENFIADGLVSHNTRWHEDDLAGRILPKNYSGQSGMIECRDGKVWEVINLPAQAEHLDDPLGRQVGEYIWPEWFDEAHWGSFKLNSRTWAALFQQRPRPDEGGVFKASWCIDRYRVIPRDAKVCVHSWDTAQKEKQINDPSVGTFWHFGQGTRYHLREVYRDRVDYPTLKAKVIAYAERDRPAAILIEDKSSGQSLIQELRQTTNLPVVPIEPEGNKLFRAQEVSTMVESGLLALPQAGELVDVMGRPLSAPWLIDFEAEFFGFPLSTNDDQVDSVSQFLRWVRGWSGSIESYGAGLTRTQTEGMFSARETGGGFGSIRRSESTEGF